MKRNVSRLKLNKLKSCRSEFVPVSSRKYPETLNAGEARITIWKEKKRTQAEIKIKKIS